MPGFWPGPCSGPEKRPLPLALPVPDRVDPIQEQLATMAGSLGNIREQVGDAAARETGGDAVKAMAPYLERLERMVEATLKSQLETQHGRALTGAVHDLLDKHVEDVEKQLLPALHSVQRKLKIGYNRAARLVESMEMAGVVSEAGHNGQREVLAPPAPE